MQNNKINKFTTLFTKRLQNLLISTGMHKSLLLLFIFHLALITNIEAQVVNIEKQRTDKNKAFYGNVQASMQYENSKKVIWQNSTSSDLYFRWGRHYFMSFTSWDYISAGKENLQDKGHEHIRYNFMIDSLFAFEIFGQYQFNDLRKIKYRTLGGAGLRLNIIAGDSLKWFTGSSIMYEERYFTYKAPGQYHWRINLYTNLLWNISDATKLSGIVYFQPSVYNFSNHNISGEAQIQIRLIKKLSLIVNTTLTYETTPPENVANFYSVVRNGVKWEF